MKKNSLHSSLHGRLVDKIRRAVEKSQPGDRVLSVRELAAKYEVSVNTARMALVVLQHEGLISLKHGSGGYVNPAPVAPVPAASDRHIAILVELDILQPGTSPFFLKIVNRLRKVFRGRKLDYRLHIGHACEPEDSFGAMTSNGFFNDLANHHVSGVVAVATLPKIQLLQPLREQGVPIVGMNNRWDVCDASVNLDYAGMLKLGAETLIQQGCRKLAMVGWGYELVGDSRPMDDFQRTIEAHGLEFQPKWVSASLPPNLAGAGWDDLREIWSGGGERPDGLFIADDALLPDVELALRELGVRVPADLKVVLATSRGVLHRTALPVTRIENDPEAFADTMAGLLFDLMEKRELVERQLVEGYRVVEEDVRAVSVEPQLISAG